MTKQDWTALAGDPGCVETLDEWAADMTRHLLKLSADQRRRIVLDMTDDERDMLARWCGTGDTAQIEAAS